MPLIRDQIERRHKESRDLAFEYLSSLVGDASRIGVLDLGFSGDVQHNIAFILRRGGKDMRTIGCYLACTPRAARLTIAGHEAHAYLTDEWDRSTVLPSVCVTLGGGSISGYARDASGRVEPVLEPTFFSSEQTAVKQRLRDGVVGFQELWLAISRRSEHRTLPVGVLADIDRLSCAILYRWMDFPTKPEADRLGGLSHDENYFGPTKSVTLCDEDNRARFRREGARAVFENPRCYWPQGIMAQVYPRMISVVRNGWHDTRDLGRLGALSAPGCEEGGLTDSELASLEHWVTSLSPKQIVLCGAVAPSAAALVERWAQTAPISATGGAPRLIVATGCARCSKGIDSTTCGHVASELAPGGGAPAWVRGHFSSPETLRAVRAALAADTDAALVLTSDLDEIGVEALLNGLAPFLGPKGVVLVASGRYDSDEIETKSGALRPLRVWLTSGAVKTGFAPFSGRPRDQAAARDWIVFWRSPEAMDWSRQWMPLVSDLGYDTDIPADDEPAAEGAVEPAPPRPAGSVEAETTGARNRVRAAGEA